MFDLRMNRMLRRCVVDILSDFQRTSLGNSIRNSKDVSQRCRVQTSPTLDSPEISR